MDRIHYLSIQGKYAPSFWFKNQDAQNFRSLVESITSSSCLLVSSIYRTDLFYQSKTEKTDIILKAWCAFKSHQFDEHVKDKFIRARKKPNAFEMYFDTLFHLMLHPAYYDRYKDRLQELNTIEGNHGLLRELMQCDTHMTECYKEQHVPYISLSRKKATQQHHSDSFRILAFEQMERINLN